MNPHGPSGIISLIHRTAYLIIVPKIMFDLEPPNDPQCHPSLVVVGTNPLIHILEARVLLQ